MALKMVALVLALACCLQLTSAFLFPYPLHASCKIEWTFAATCNTVTDKIIAQMNAWQGSNCGSGAKCRYKVTSKKDDGFGNFEIRGTHTTPSGKYVDDLSMSLKAQQTGCKGSGYSSSRTWYAVLDKGTNYCNLFNLIEGSGLHQDPSYTETTSNKVCTQYTSANCGKANKI